MYKYIFLRKDNDEKGKKKERWKEEWKRKRKKKEGRKEKEIEDGDKG